MDNRQHQQYQYGPPQQSQGQPIPQQAPYYMFGGAPVGAPTSAPLYTSSYDPTVAAAGSSSVLGGGMGPPPPAAAAPHGWGEYYGMLTPITKLAVSCPPSLSYTCSTGRNTLLLQQYYSGVAVGKVRRSLNINAAYGSEGYRPRTVVADHPNYNSMAQR
eukprot:gb/GECG01005077.1/.p1 GENE.gb/GECG01005077.1/~~gb/GECG01005077.1/.p1  ORF type:complete len:159 (+),score=12.40 gb/GECG01005077.1/:1-477(+)